MLTSIILTKGECVVTTIIFLIIGMFIVWKPELFLRLKYGRYMKEFPKVSLIGLRILGLIAIAVGIINLVIWI